VPAEADVALAAGGAGLPLAQQVHLLDFAEPLQPIVNLLLCAILHWQALQEYLAVILARLQVGGP